MSHRNRKKHDIHTSVHTHPQHTPTTHTHIPNSRTKARKPSAHQLKVGDGCVQLKNSS